MKSVLAESVVEQATLNWLETLNYIPPDAIEDAIKNVTRTHTPSLFENNLRFHKLLTDAVDMEYQAENRTIYDKVRLIDFTNPDNNDWLAVNQFTVIENKNNRRPDVVIFINGLPLGVIELKNPTDENVTCPKPDTSENEHQRFCQSCGSQLLLNRFLLFFRTSLLIEVIAGDRLNSGFKV